MIKMENNSDFETYTLPNGLTVALKRTASPNIFSNLRINHGALHEVEGEEGTAHFLEHMLCEGGTLQHSPEEQARVRGSFGYTNAFTSRSTTEIPGGIISSDLDVYLNMISQMAFLPLLDKKVLGQQKKVVLSEVSRTKGSPSFEDIQRFFNPTIARDREHTYFVLGSEDVITNLNEEKLRSFHIRGYSPNNMVLMLAGNLPVDIVSKVEKYFGKFNPGFGKPIEFPKVRSLEKRAIRHSFAPDLLNKENLETSNSYLGIGIVVPDEFHVDSAALTVASEIFGGSWTIGLKKRIRSDEGLSYDIGSTYDGDENFGYFGIGGKIIARRQEEAVSIVFEELGKLKNERLDPDEISRAKKRLKYESTNVLCKMGMIVGIDPLNVVEIAKMSRVFEGRPSIEKKLEEIENVSSGDIQRVANLYLPSDREHGNYVLLLRDPLKEN